MPLPEGFEIDTPPSSGARPKLPAGFQLDTPKLPEGFVLDSESNAQELGKTPGLAQRGMALLDRGVAGVKNLLRPALTPLFDVFRNDPGENVSPAEAAAFRRGEYIPPTRGLDETYGPSVTGVMLPGIGPGIVPINTQIPGRPIPMPSVPMEQLHPAVQAAMLGVGKPLQFAAENLNPVTLSTAGAAGAMGPTALKALGIAFGVPMLAETLPEQLGQTSVQPTPENIADVALTLGTLGAIGHGVSPGKVQLANLPPEAPTLATLALRAKPEVTDLRFLPGREYKGEVPTIRPRPLFYEEPADARFQKPPPSPIISPSETKPGRMLTREELQLPEIPGRAGQISFAGQEGVPSAMQSKAMVQPPATQMGERRISTGGEVGSGIQVDDYDRYQELMQQMKLALGKKDYDTVFKLQTETEAIKNRNPIQPGMPPEAPTGKAALRPAVNIGGRILKGNVGETHADILQRNGINPNMVPHEDARRGFVDITKPDQFLDRRTAEKQAGVVGTAKAGGLDSQDLIGKEAPSAIRELRPDSISETQPPGNIQKVEQEVRQGAEAEGDAQRRQKEEVEPTQLYAGVNLEDMLKKAGEFFKRFPVDVATSKNREAFMNDLVRRYPRPFVEREGKNVGFDATPIEEIGKVYGKDWRKGVSEYLKRVEEIVRRRSEFETTEGEGEGPTSFYSGMPLRLERDRPKGSLEAFWMHFAGHLLPETEDYQLAREVVNKEEPKTPMKGMTDEGAKRLEQDMMSKGFTKVVRQGDTYFVDNNASNQQLAGIRNQAKAEGRKVQTMNLYSGAPLGEAGKKLQDYLGNFHRGAFRGVAVKDVTDTLHSEAGLTADAETGWRYKAKDKTVAWNSPPTEEMKASVEAFLEKRGVTGVRHLDLGSSETAFEKFFELHAGINPFKSDAFRDILDRLYGHGVTRTPDEAVSQVSKKWSGYTAPAHVAANEEVANRMVEYAAADITRQVNPRLGQAYKDAALRNWIEEGIRSGLYKYAQRGQPNTLAGGEPTVGFDVRATGIGHKSLRVRADLAPEVDMILNGTGKSPKAGAQFLLDLATELQIIGPTDVTFHSANMYSSIARSPGKSANYVLDQLLRAPGVKHLDTVGRIGYNIYKAIQFDPQVQAQLEQISKLGALRGEGSQPSLLSKGVRAGVEKVAGQRAGEIAGNLTDTGKWIKIIDRAGRLARNKMFDNLVEQGLARDTAVDRREFINKMGQYNDKLMSKIQATAKQYTSQFVVAGRTFNRNAWQSISASNEFRAASPSAWAKAKISNLIALYSTAVALPIVANYIITGRPFGRDSVPLGKIDTGKDDEKTGQPITVDPMQLDLSRRGFRISGAEAIAEGLRKGEDPEEYLPRAAWAAFLGQLHPWEGPPVRVIEEGLGTYKATHRPGEAIKAALKAINPTLTAFFSKDEGGERGGLKAVGKQLGTAVGIGRGKYPTDVERVEKAAGKPVGGMSLEERISTERAVKHEKEPASEMEKAKGAARAIENEARRGVAMKESLDKPTQQWIDSRKLIVPGYDNKLDFGKTKVYLTPKESDRLDALVKQEYQRTIDFLKTDKEFNSLSRTEQQEVFHRAMSGASHRARGMMKEELAKAAPGNAQEMGKTRKKRYRVYTQPQPQQP